MGAYPYPNNQLITRDMHDLLHSQDIVELHYSEILELRDSHNLIPDTLYRIIDYQCKSSDPNTQCAGHQFDIIVLALSENTLSERARAIQNQNDSYFANSKLEAWQVWYCLDNDTSRFQWAHTDGTGVIYRLIDEFNNDCPYDFKNIMFKRDITDSEKLSSWAQDVLGQYTSTYYFYTFSWVDENDNVFDLSIIGNDGRLKSDTQSIYGCYDNKISLCNGGWEDIQSDKFLQILNNNVIVNSANYDGGLFYGCSSNTFGNGCSSNTFGSYCYSNTFGNDCYSNTFGNGCYSNTFGSYCYSNTFGSYCYFNTFGSYCYSNTFGSYCSSNTFGSYCSSNTFGSYCYSNTFGSYCSSNTFGSYCYSNTFGSYCYFNTFGTNKTSTQSYCRYIIFQNGIQYVNFTCTQTTSSSKYCQNILLHSGLIGTYSAKLAVQINVTSITYSLEVGKTSAGTLKIWNPAD